MVIALGLAVGLVVGAPLPALAMLGLAAWQPVWFLAAVVIWVLLGRRSTGTEEGVAEGAFLRAVSAELRAGSSLRHALGAAADRAPGLSLQQTVRLAASGQPLEAVADSLEVALPRLGGLTAAATRAAGRTGGRAADVFEGLALIVQEELELVRERRAATAQARFSAVIVAGIPLLYLAYAGVTGKLAVLVAAGTVGVVLLGVGFVLLLGGTLAIWSMVRKAEQ